MKIRNMLGKTLLAAVVPMVFSCAAGVKQAGSVDTGKDAGAVVCNYGSIELLEVPTGNLCIGSISGYTVIDARCDGAEVKVCDSELAGYAVAGKQKVQTDCFGPDSETTSKVKEAYRLCLGE